MPFEAFLYTRDCWHPATVTGTWVGIEDVLYSIGNGGYMAALYPRSCAASCFTTAGRRLKHERLAPIAAISILPFVLSLGVGLHSFVATSIGSLVALAIVLAARADLARMAVVSGIIGTGLASRST